MRISTDVIAIYKDSKRTPFIGRNQLFHWEFLWILPDNKHFTVGRRSSCLEITTQFANLFGKSYKMAHFHFSFFSRDTRHMKSLCTSKEATPKALQRAIVPVFSLPYCAIERSRTLGRTTFDLSSVLFSEDLTVTASKNEDRQ